MIKPMLASDARGDFDKVPYGWIIEPKLDGWRWQVHVTPNGVTSTGGRNGREYRTPPQLVASLSAVVPVNTILDGELLPLERGMHAPKVGSLLSRGGEGLVFVAFDVLRVTGHDVTGLSWRDRRELLEQCMAGVDAHATTSAYVDRDESIHQRWLDLGFEGSVAKNPASTYHAGKRSREWMKVKPQETTDAIVMGWKMGEGASNRDRVGALEIRLCETDEPTTVAFDTTPEEAITLIGRRIELRHHGWQKSGKVRHPAGAKFVRTREDME